MVIPDESFGQSPDGILASSSRPGSREPTPDESMGMAWWNLMTKVERSVVMGASEVVLGRGASVAEAWGLWKAGKVSMRWETAA